MAKATPKCNRDKRVPHMRVQHIQIHSHIAIVWHPGQKQDNNTSAERKDKTQHHLVLNLGSGSGSNLGLNLFSLSLHVSPATIVDAAVVVVAAVGQVVPTAS